MSVKQIVPTGYPQPYFDCSVQVKPDTNLSDNYRQIEVLDNPAMVSFPPLFKRWLRGPCLLVVELVKE